MRSVLLASAALSLVGCDKLPPKHNKAICLTPPGAALVEATSLNAQKEISEGCIHRWAYRLAHSNESVPVVAEAAITACRDAIEHELKFAPTLPEGFVLDPISPETHPRYFALARYRVVQARAGNCDIP